MPTSSRLRQNNNGSNAFPPLPGCNPGMDKPRNESAWKWITQAAFPAKAVVVGVVAGLAARAWWYVAVVICLVAIAFGLQLFVSRNRDNR
jgi:hypothetical protein